MIVSETDYETNQYTYEKIIKKLNKVLNKEKNKEPKQDKITIRLSSEEINLYQGFVDLSGYKKSG